MGSADPPIETVATFWAHYDDDLIFANPTVQHALDRGQRTRSFFFTAGDAGTGMSDTSTGERPASAPPTTTCAVNVGNLVGSIRGAPNGVTVTVTRPDGDDRSR